MTTKDFVLPVAHRYYNLLDGKQSFVSSFQMLLCVLIVLVFRLDYYVSFCQRVHNTLVSRYLLKCFVNNYLHIFLYIYSVFNKDDKSFASIIVSCHKIVVLKPEMTKDEGKDFRFSSRMQHLCER